MGSSLIVQIVQTELRSCLLRGFRVAEQVTVTVLVEKAAAYAQAEQRHQAESLDGFDHHHQTHSGLLEFGMVQSLTLM